MDATIALAVIAPMPGIWANFWLVALSRCQHRTLNGKKMEAPARKLHLGSDAGMVASPDVMQNPDRLAFYVKYAKSLQSGLRA
jgi:hypothetical protein